RLQLDAGRRHLEVVRGLAGGRDLDPALGGTVAFLDRGEVEHLSGRQAGGQHAAEDEFVIEFVRQLAAAPDHFLDAFRDLRAVVLVGLLVLALHGFQLPAGLRHRLHGDDAFRNLDADDLGRLAVAAVRHTQHRLVSGADGRFLDFEGGVGESRGRAESEDGRGEEQFFQHGGIPHRYRWPAATGPDLKRTEWIAAAPEWRGSR